MFKEYGVVVTIWDDEYDDKMAALLARHGRTRTVPTVPYRLP